MKVRTQYIVYRDLVKRQLVYTHLHDGVPFEVLRFGKRKLKTVPRTIKFYDVGFGMCTRYKSINKAIQVFKDFVDEEIWMHEVYLWNKLSIEHALKQYTEVRIG